MEFLKWLVLFFAFSVQGCIDINTGDDSKPNIEVKNLALGKKELLPPNIREVEKRETSSQMRESIVTLPVHKETIAIEQEERLDESAEAEEESNEKDLEYEYEDISEEIASPLKNTGHRLVNAATTRHDNIPFLVIFTTFKCSGSLIAPNWVMTAAHCTNNVLGDHNIDKYIGPCIHFTKQNGIYKKKGFHGQCREDRKGNYIISLKTRPWEAYVGVDNYGRLRSERGAMKFQIFTVVRHAASYKSKRNGGLGTYGGHDISLLKLSKPVPKHIGTPACLPSIRFQDVRRSTVAGYGKSTRTKCMTDEFSPSKFHYCQKKLGGNVCEHVGPPPAQDATCTAFFKKIKLSEITRFGYEEFVVYDSRANPHKCYFNESRNARSRGWCFVENDLYKYNTRSRLKSYAPKWGFCSDDCYFTPNHKTGTLRIKEGTDVLPEELCDQYLNNAREGEKFEHRPEFLCVGDFRKWKTGQFWEDLSGSGVIKHQPFKSSDSRFHMNYQVAENYTVSPGICSGDSGGPLFLNIRGRFVVTGITSQGGGKAGQCGGYDNPAFYARVKHFDDWISQMVGPDRNNICWIDE